jgi:hypothetical protein
MFVHTKTIHYTLWAIHVFCTVTKTYWRIHVGCNVASILKVLERFPKISQLTVSIPVPETCTVSDLFNNAFRNWDYVQSLAELRIWMLLSVRVTKLKKKKKNMHIEVMTLLKVMPILFCARGWKRGKIKLAEEYCWAMTQGTRRSCCGRSGYSVLETGY